jgi:hypothetical protein
MHVIVSFVGHVAADIVFIIAVILLLNIYVLVFELATIRNDRRHTLISIGVNGGALLVCGAAFYCLRYQWGF